MDVELSPRDVEAGQIVDAVVAFVRDLDRDGRSPAAAFVRAHRLISAVLEERDAARARAPEHPIPLMRIADVNELWQQHGKGAASLGLDVPTLGPRWMMLNTGATSPELEPEAIGVEEGWPNWDNLLVVAVPGSGPAGPPPAATQGRSR